MVLCLLKDEMKLNIKPINLPESLAAAAVFAKSLGKRIEPGTYFVVICAFVTMRDIAFGFFQLLATLK
jgi:hypothetical protein